MTAERPRTTFFVVQRLPLSRTTTYLGNSTFGVWTQRDARKTFRSYQDALRAAERWNGWVCTDPHPWHEKPVGRVA